ncbi:hypothetical protein M3Y98_00603700 [Aphelenchoides besseyi]|nr:hypothetical protein M3Y98_00603700 [Aphelenchoides besseyi]KAI6208215.1 hypothetical protein M3Y96_00091700 [Aphelenchoides besseyi]
MTSKSNQECENAIKQFAEITNTNEALAHSILQDVDYNLEEAVFRYYMDPSSGDLPGEFSFLYCQHFRLDCIINEVLAAEESKSKANAQESSTFIEEGSRKRALDDTHVEASSSKRVIAEKDGDDDVMILSSSKAVAQVPATEDSEEYPQEITVMSYNVDGLDEVVLNARFTAALHVVANINPDIVFFQEIVPAIEGKLRNTLGSMYHIFSAQPHSEYPYYTMTAVSKCVKIKKTDVIGFGHSIMGRNMLCVEGQWKGLKVRLINSHLESMWDHTKTRREQFVQAMDKMRVYSADPNALCIFGGDLNLLDPEVSKVPPNVKDAWIAAGEDKLQKYTWDCKLNDNKNLKPNLRRRFDRFYYSGPYQKVQFHLAGTERRKDVKRFPSDHFAIVCKLTSPKRA